MRSCNIGLKRKIVTKNVNTFLKIVREMAENTSTNLQPQEKLKNKTIRKINHSKGK